MALSNLTGWNEKSAASACGAGDKPEEKPAACGSAGGAVVLSGILSNKIRYYRFQINMKGCQTEETT